MNDVGEPLPRVAPRVTHHRATTPAAAGGRAVLPYLACVLMFFPLSRIAYGEIAPLPTGRSLDTIDDAEFAAFDVLQREAEQLAARRGEPESDPADHGQANGDTRRTNENEEPDENAVEEEDEEQGDGTRAEPARGRDAEPRLARTGKPSSRPSRQESRQERSARNARDGLIRATDAPKTRGIPAAPDVANDAIDHPDADRGDPITLEVQNVDLSTVLDAFADFTGLNIIASERVHGNVSLRLHGVPWRSAFAALLDAQGLAMRQRDNVVWVAPAAEFALRARQKSDAFALQRELEPLRSEAFELRYQRAEDVRRLITGSGSQRLLSRRGAASADPRTNLLFVTDLPARLAQMRAMIASVDRPVRQVLIEARIVEAEDGFARNLGARLAFGSRVARPGDGAAKEGDSDAQSDESQGNGRFVAGNGTVYDLPAGALDGLSAATAALTLFRAGVGALLSLELSALEADGRGRILSSPRVVTADRAKALIEQGTELPYQAKVRSGISGVQFRKAGLKLEVTPNITPNGQVTLDVDVAKDSVGKLTLAGPAINTKHVRTQVRVEDGGTVAIGGIYTRDQRTEIERVPLLGRLPLIGALFRRQSKSDRKSELIVFITPTVVRGAAALPPPNATDAATAASGDPGAREP